MQKKVIYFSKFIILVILMYMPLFGHLNTQPIRLFDESRLSMNAIQMSENGNLLVTYYGKKPDLWNTKPPLMIWFQVILLRTIGINELSIRLPSAFASFFTCIITLILSIKYLKRPAFGLISILILITSNGYVELHGIRTGDYDSLLTLFTTAYGLCFFMFCESHKSKYLYLFYFCLVLAVFTKGVAGMLFLPALVIYVLLSRNLRTTFSNPHLYIGLLIGSIIIFGYYYLRELANSGYIQAVIENELGGRYIDTIELHHNGFWFYLSNLFNFQYTEWIILIPLGIGICLVLKNSKLKRLTVFSTIMVVSYFLIISSSQTKLRWYDLPLYPYLSMIGAVFIYFIFNLIKRSNHVSGYNHIVSYLFLLFIFFYPYYKIFNKTYLPKENAQNKVFFELSYYLKKAVDNLKDVNGYTLLYDGYNAHLLFYIKCLEENSTKVGIIGFGDRYSIEGMHIIAFQANVVNFIENNFDYEITEIDGNVKKYKVNGRNRQQN